jgi:hypothetical protein
MKTPLRLTRRSREARRANHLTCANSKGRTRAQFEAECRPAPEPAPD